MSEPQLSLDGREMELRDDDGLSNSSIKGSIAYDYRDEEYVMVWWQTPFRIATKNGAYSMTASLLDEIPDNIETIWVADEENDELLRMERSFYEDDEVRTIIEPDSKKFKSVTPRRQYAVDRSHATERYNLYDIQMNV